MGTYTMKELPVSERPYEKLELYGEKSLSDAELLAIVIKTGTRTETSLDIAQRVLKECITEEKSLSLANTTLAKLQKIKGIGRVKAITLKAVFELAVRFNSPIDEKVFVGNTELAGRYLMSKLSYEKQEKFMVLGLNIKSQLIKSEVIAVGQLNQVNIKPREIFRSALECGCAGIIVAHNHPSGDPTPSNEDLKFTSNLVELGRIMDIDVCDHIVVGNNAYTSIREKNFIKW